MSTGVTGALDPNGGGDFSTHYAIAVAYRVQVNWSNKVTVDCKRCGVKLQKGEGTCVVVTSINGPYATSPFFCAACVEWVARSLEVVMDRQAKDRTKSAPRGER